jgi:thioredoxin reductase
LSDAEGFKIVTKAAGESSIPGLFVLGALRQGHSQAIISAGQGAEAAIEISTRSYSDSSRYLQTIVWFKISPVFKDSLTD